ncbi:MULTISPECIES: hypothetical protein [Cohnella]|uniref:hypothetical protein n=1 Tax=Cohnella TaxID=329857 RepID=UPI0015947DE3|nr:MULTISPECIES: hypothetical protein [Cohnella]MBN2984803.1 hypothetical protein [Cohnella algarum]
MRQSGKEAKLLRWAREGTAAERREALALQAGAEFADEPGGSPGFGGALGRRHPPGGRG